MEVEPLVHVMCSNGPSVNGVTEAMNITDALEWIARCRLAYPNLSFKIAWSSD
jgi:hypothetical protein